MTTSEALTRAKKLFGDAGAAVKRKGSTRAGRSIEFRVGVWLEGGDPPVFITKGVGRSWEAAFANAAKAADLHRID